MIISPLSPDFVGLPKFNIQGLEEKLAKESFSFFDLSSHHRAKKALEFGAKMRSNNAHIFVVAGEDSGRMTGTVEFLQESIQKLPPVFDWVYLNNFVSGHRPLPFCLPAGMGSHLKVVLKEFVEAIRDIAQKTFSSPAYLKAVNSLTSAMEGEIRSKMDEMQNLAHSKGLYVELQGNEFKIITLGKEDEKNDTEPEKSYTAQDIQEIRELISKVTSAAHLSNRQVVKKIQDIKKEEAQKIMVKVIQSLNEFSPYLGGWIAELENDVLEHIDDFLEEEEEGLSKIVGRYAVNLLVDNKITPHSSVIIDPSPSYESLFGSIKYNVSPNGYKTDFRMIRAGSLHRANGGILVLQAEDLANNQKLWNAIKMALRDKVIRIEEHYRENSMPMLDAPDPKPIPLDVQIVLVGSPMWYYSFFFNDPDFRSYFRIKADIEPDLPTTQSNIDVYAKLIHCLSQDKAKKNIEIEAIEYALGYSCRWVSDRTRFSSKFEVLADIVGEAGVIASESASEVIRLVDIKEAFSNRRIRNGNLEDRSYRGIESGVVLIDTIGKKIGQINALTVLNTGDHQYGMPNRISARTYVGKEGVINIERLTELGGPIQQKGAMILDGYINGLFAQKHPVSFNCSLTFEQNYGEVEGDSATLAELLAILSSLSQIPLRQDLAVTGSLNQFGQVQAIGGIIHKVEGFFRTCQKRGLTGTQGVVIPKANISNLILREEVTEAIQDSKFSLWAVDNVAEAIALFMDKPAGKLDAKGSYSKNTIFSLVRKQLKGYQKSMNQHFKDK